MRVLVLTKTARLRYELRAHGARAAPSAELDVVQPPNESMREACAAHEAVVSGFCTALEHEGVSVDQIAIDQATAALGASGRPVPSSGWDLVCAVGGDGTLLRAASILPPMQPILAVNSDPKRSTGALCALGLSPDDHEAAAAAASAVALRRFEVRPLPRLLATVGGSIQSPLRAVNELSLTEVNPSRPLSFELTVDDEDAPRMHRASGCLAATQVGATAWAGVAQALDDRRVAAVLAAAAADGSLIRGGEGGGGSSDSESVRRITAAVNAQFMQHSAPHLLQFVVRESLPKAACARPPPAQGFARRLTLRPTGYDVMIHADGVQGQRVPSNGALTIQVDPDPRQWLHAVHLDAYAPARPTVQALSVQGGCNRHAQQARTT